MTGTAPLSNIEIAQRATMKPIVPLGLERLGIPEEHLHPFGRYKAKLALDYCEHVNGRPDGKLVLVTAMSPTPAGEGKTTMTVSISFASIFDVRISRVMARQYPEATGPAIMLWARPLFSIKRSSRA